MSKHQQEEYRIGVVSRMFRIHSQTLRLYEREGLLRPRRSVGNTRRYSQEDVERVARILWLTREMGVNLAGVEIILELHDRMHQMRQEMMDQMVRLRQVLDKKLDKKKAG